MFGFFKRKPISEREGLRADFDEFIAGLRTTDTFTRMEIGYCINIINTAFMKHFGSIEAFQGLPKAEKLAYMASLRKAKELATPERPTGALGYVLFLMWIAAVVEKDHELMAHFGEGLSELSREGDLPIPA